MRRAWPALLLFLALPAPAAAATAEPLWSIKVVASGSFVADYGDERLEPSQSTSAGVDGQGSGSWRWVMKAVGEGTRLDARAAIIRMSVSEQQDIVVYSIQTGRLSEAELCSPVPAHNETAWVKHATLDFHRSGRGFQISHAFDGLLAGCVVGEHGMAYYDGASPSETRVPRGAFDPRFDRTYSETWGQDIALGREHDTSDPNKLHTFTAGAELTITVKRISERKARRLTKSYRSRPRDNRI